MNRALVFAGLVAGTVAVAAVASWLRLPKPPPEAPRVHVGSGWAPRVVPDYEPGVGRWTR